MTTQHDLEPIVRDWLHNTLDTIPDPTHRYGLVASEVNETPQQRNWMPVPLPAQHTMWSTTKSIVAISIVALFGGFLLFGALTGPEVDEAIPATVPEASAFPTGTFVSEDDEFTLEFRPDGTCVRAGTPCTFGVRGGFYVEMTFEDPSGAQVPAVYRWDFDGEQLTFEPHGQDLRPNRREVYADRTYRLMEGGEPLVTAAETGFPVGRLVSADGSDGALNIRKDGTIGLPYAYNGDLFTEFYQYPGEATVPATYRWRWDGERLSFVLWGEDANAYRRQLYGRVYVMDPDTSPLGETRSLLLSDPRLDVWVRVELSKSDDGRHKATATVDGELLGEGIGDTVPEAVKAALEPLGEPFASDMADNVTG